MSIKLLYFDFLNLSSRSKLTTLEG